MTNRFCNMHDERFAQLTRRWARTFDATPQTAEVNRSFDANMQRCRERGQIIHHDETRIPHRRTNFSGGKKGTRSQPRFYWFETPISRSCARMSAAIILAHIDPRIHFHAAQNCPRPSVFAHRADRTDAPL